MASKNRGNGKCFDLRLLQQNRHKADVRQDLLIVRVIARLCERRPITVLQVRNITVFMDTSTNVVS
jgi:hypothetical protein